MHYILRDYDPTTDCREAAELFWNTVHRVNAADYTAEQLRAWTSGAEDIECWGSAFENCRTLVAVADGIIVGFGSMYGCYLDRLYVHKDFQRQGIATAICDELERPCGGRLSVHASITAKQFFLNRGYHVVKEQTVERQNVSLTNFVMEKNKSAELSK